MERIVGKEFLPKGTGTQTRRPLMLRLIHNPAVLEPHAYIGTGDMAQKKGPLHTEGTVQTSVTS